MASILPRSTSTARGSLPCWMTPATTSPSRPAYSPKVSSSSASRSRCRITWRAVVAAIRPKPSGVSSYSRTGAPSGPVSVAHTVTCPVRRSISTRAVGAAPSVRWYATSSASSMALMASSIEMSFSLSRLRRTLKSMSIWLPLVRGPGRHGWAGRAAELHLHLASAQIAVAEVVRLAVDVQGHPVRPGLEDAARHGTRAARRDRDTDQPAAGPPPVPRLDERAVHAGRAHLQRVRVLTHHPGAVQFRRQRPAEQGDVVQAR